MIAETDIREWAFFILIAAGALVVVAFAIQILVTGGNGRFKFGKFETSIDTGAMLKQIQEHTAQIRTDVAAVNTAVNHQEEGSPPLIERIINLDAKLIEHVGQTTKGFAAVRADVKRVNDRLEAHICSTGVTEVSAADHAASGATAKTSAAVRKPK